MQEVRIAIVNRLSDDTALYPGLVPGGIYDRPLKPGQGQGATPSAWWVNPLDPARIVRLRESIVVLGPNEAGAVDGFVSTAGVHGVLDFLRIFYYVPATASGKQALDAIDLRVRQLLDGWQFPLSTGYSLTVNVIDEMTGPLEDEQFEGSLMCQRRIVGEYLRAAA